MIRDALKHVWKPIDSRIAPRVGTSIWDRDWDICCVLDGCRADTFDEATDADTESVRSIASTSQTWLPRTFDDRDLGGVGYITGNPYAPRLDEQAFAHFHLEPVHETAYGIETVPPTPLAERAISVWCRRDELGIDRLVVHFMQPHVPFRSRPEWFTEWLETGTWGSKAWGRVDDDVDREAWFAAYRDNLRWAIEDGVDPIRRSCDDVVAITADHGNAAGEWGFSGHPAALPIRAVRRVPWVTIQGLDERSDTPSVDRSADQAAVDTDAQLRALGYK